MRTTILSFGLTAAALGSGHTAAAQTTDTSSATTLSVAYDLRVVSRYLWRGYDLSRGRPAAQLSVELWTAQGLGVSAFGSGALDRRTELDEVQLAVSYTRALGAWELTACAFDYVATGTETAPAGDPDRPDATSTSVELAVTVARTVGDGGYAALTYSRGLGSAAGNGINLWLQGTLSFGGDRFAAEPYVQLDYLDAYGAPARLLDRFAGAEAGVPLAWIAGPVRLSLTGHVTVVPSSFVYGTNLDAAGGTARVLPWASVGVSGEFE
jgi:hypothetical protein